MTTRMALYGSVKDAINFAKVGDKGKTPLSLAARMPSPEIFAKVGVKGVTPRSLAARMPSPEIAAKVGIDTDIGERTRRVVRRSARD